MARVVFKCGICGLQVLLANNIIVNDNNNIMKSGRLCLRFITKHQFNKCNIDFTVHCYVMNRMLGQKHFVC